MSSVLKKEKSCATQYLTSVTISLFRNFSRRFETKMTRVRSPINAYKNHRRNFSIESQEMYAASLR